MRRSEEEAPRSSWRFATGRLGPRIEGRRLVNVTVASAWRALTGRSDNRQSQRPMVRNPPELEGRNGAWSSQSDDARNRLADIQLGDDLASSDRRRGLGPVDLNDASRSEIRPRLHHEWNLDLIIGRGKCLRAETEFIFPGPA